MNSRIIAFTKDWDDVPTSATHILRGMGKDRPVLWISSIGTRKFNMGSRKDLSRVSSRLCSCFRRAELKENNIRVLKPVLIPQAKFGFSRWFNRKLLSALIARELRDMGSGLIEYWCFVPNAVDFVPGKHENCGAENSVCKVVYYCVDDWEKFKNLDGRWMKGKEEEMLDRADVIFAASRYLEKKCRLRAGERVHYMPHGVTYDKFSAALEIRKKGIPSDMASFQKPVIGFYGNIYPWIDFDLVEWLAENRPKWSFVLIGEVFCDISRLKKLKNIHFTGRREHDNLPAYCAGFDAGIIPYDMKDLRMESVHPAKTREFLAAGVPVVACDLPEFRQENVWGDALIVCGKKEEWLAALERQISRKDHVEISKRVAGEDWSERIKRIRAVVDACSRA